MVEMFGFGVIGIIAMFVAGFVVMAFGAKDENGDYPNDGLKGFLNYVFFIVVGGIVISIMANIG